MRAGRVGLRRTREQQFGPDMMRAIERAWRCGSSTSLWIQHLTAIDDLREGIGLRAYGQRDPLVEYKREAHEMWESLLDIDPPRDRPHDLPVVPRTEPVRTPAPAGQPPGRIESSENGAATAARAPQKVGRNDQCPCGSGRKYKKCHGR